MRTINRSIGTSLGNWRTHPHSQWAFQNVRELIPTAAIPAGVKSRAIDHGYSPDPAAKDADELIAELERLETDSIVILKDGKKLWQWAAPHCETSKPHIVFSISKSISALMAGCLWGQGLLDTSKPISHYLEKTRGGGYGDCTLQQLLDMQVSLAFTEDYTDKEGDYFRYRNTTAWNPVDQTAELLSLETFLYGLEKGLEPHGQSFAYKSPNSDLLGLLLERVAGKPYAELLSELIWAPMGAKSDGYVTVDSALLARGAGGICVTIDDLARLGQLFLERGSIDGHSVIPESWIHDTCHNGDRQAWLNGDFTDLLPEGAYRNKWYQMGDPDCCMLGLGIHGQWLLINPGTNVVIVKFSSQANPFDDDMDIENLRLLRNLSRSF